jgi:hypothetical protein
MKRIVLFSGLALLMLSAVTLFAQRRYEGRPPFHAREPRRYVIWEQRGVFHLRTTTASALNRFQGVIVASDGTFTEVRRVRIDAGDWVRLSRDGRRISFTLSLRRAEAELGSGSWCRKANRRRSAAPG